MPTARWVISTPTGARVPPGVLQVRNIVHTELGADEVLPFRIRYLIDDDDLWSMDARDIDQEILDGNLGRRGRQHDGRLGIAKRRMETFGVPGQFGREQRHRDGARLDRRVEPRDIVDALRRENRDALTAGRSLLNARTDGLQADAELDQVTS